MHKSGNLRTGISTGTCAAAAARAAAMLLLGSDPGDEVEVKLPAGKTVKVRIAEKQVEKGLAQAMVCKDGGDDPDETHGLLIGARIKYADQGITITGGKGVGQVTRPGLAVAPGNPAINPVPLEMIRASVAAVTDRAVDVEIFVPDGESIAARTFNQRLGIVGGISILGTSGIVRPFSVEAIKETIFLNLKIVLESGSSRPVLVPGRIGFKAALGLGFCEKDIVEVSNEWGFALKKCCDLQVMDLVIVGHPGKLLKFLSGYFQTHSKKSASAVPVFEKAARKCLNWDIPGLNTVEQGIQAMNAHEKSVLGPFLAEKVKIAVKPRVFPGCSIHVALTDLKGEVIGRS
ncbi:MAG: cobalt-precorrin-5B (C(1))-methyltransferase CbiD [Desulfonatronovibrio sp.]